MRREISMFYWKRVVFKHHQTLLSFQNRILAVYFMHLHVLVCLYSCTCTLSHSHIHTPEYMLFDRVINPLADLPTIHSPTPFSLHKNVKYK